MRYGENFKLVDDTLTSFTPLNYIDGYLPIRDHGLIGDGTTSALVGRDGAVVWLCIPRFDSAPIFCRILDASKGGHFTVAPDVLVESRQYYKPGTGILITEMRSPAGIVRLTDTLTFRSGSDLGEDSSAGRGELLRLVEVLHGHVRLRIDISPHGGSHPETLAGGLSLRCPDWPGIDLWLFCTKPLSGRQTLHELDEGQRLQLVLRWGGGGYRHFPDGGDAILSNTIDAWRRWLQNFNYEGPQTKMVRRSTITLKMLDYFENGAMVAAPTCSLPEILGGTRNWDYRYAWVRDVAFSIYALNRVGMTREARQFIGWILDVIERDRRPRVLYSLDGKRPKSEWEDSTLEGYRSSLPVRWGNAASGQRQHDVYGEIIDCAYQWARRGGLIDEHLWKRLRMMVEAAAREWQLPDHGIWEIRTKRRPFTYSAAMCHVALDRGANLAECYKLPGNTAEWRATANLIKRNILKDSWDTKRNSLTECLGGGGLDASVLALPLRRMISASHPKMVASTEAIIRWLGAGNGLLYRYIPEESPDGLPGHEGAFLICSFWLVDNLARQGRLDEAMDLFDSLCARASSLGLLPEQIDPSTGAFLGNYPQAFSHVGLISSGVNLVRCIRGQ